MLLDPMTLFRLIDASSTFRLETQRHGAKRGGEGREKFGIGVVEEMLNGVSYFTGMNKVLVRRVATLLFLNLLMSPLSSLFSTFARDKSIGCEPRKFIPQKSLKFKINARHNFSSHSISLSLLISLLLKNEAESEREPTKKTGLI